MGERYMKITLAADEAGDIARSMRETTRRGPAAIMRAREDECERIEALRDALRDTELTIKRFVFQLKAGVDAEPHQYLRQAEQELAANRPQTQTQTQAQAQPETGTEGDRPIYFGHYPDQLTG